MERVTLTFINLVWLLVNFFVVVFADSSYVKHCSEGVTAYNAGQWQQCYDSIKLCIKEHRQFVDDVVSCRLKCSKLTENIYDSLDFWEYSVKRGHCLQHCKGRYLDGKEQEDIEKANEHLKNRMVYNYLQFCAYHVANPANTDAIKNIHFYETLKISAREFKDLEATNPENQQYYNDAVGQYHAGHYVEAAHYMEKAVKFYYTAHARCRALCEDAGSQDGRELYSMIAARYRAVVECQYGCSNQLAREESGGVAPLYLANHYHYLQFAYYKVNELEKAAEMVASYLLLHPEDETMRKNKAYYKARGLRDEVFTPREDLKRHIRLLKHMERVLKYFQAADKAKEDEVKASSQKEEQAAKPADGGSKKNIIKPDERKPPAGKYAPRDKKYEEAFKKANEAEGLRVVSHDEELQGRNRVATDGFLTEKECKMLKQLAEMAVEGAVKNHEVALYLRASEHARDHLARFLGLQQPLHFHFTHLDQKKRDDLSHPVHSDNCHILPDGSCLKEEPAYIWRDYSGSAARDKYAMILYLSDEDEFEGGDFFWAHPNKTVQQRVAPRCGRAVGFEASDYHGVLPVTAGRRCAIALWFTLDPAYKESAHAYARNLLGLHAAPSQDPRENAVFQAVLAENLGSHLTSHEQELNGTSRFVVDLLAQQEECHVLMQLANLGMETNSGYAGTPADKTSPYSDSERFAGLMVSSAVQRGEVGDGYRQAHYPDQEKIAKTSPFTENEQFRGIRVDEAAKMVKEKQVAPRPVQLFLDVANRAREVTEAYFNIPKDKLYFDFTHLVCRQSLKEDPKREDLSHPIHSDNCLLQPDGECIKVRPAYTERDYSALLYLNGDFEGGEFIFAHKNLSTQAEVKPRCGRMVSFDAGILHGVKPVIKGQRCALALWFTLDKSYNEAAHIEARQTLKDLYGKAEGPKRPLDEL